MIAMALQALLGCIVLWFALFRSREPLMQISGVVVALYCILDAVWTVAQL